MRTHVAVGILYNSKGNEVLITKRTSKQHLAGYWEFPGGKVESGEDVQMALGRELEEELGIVVNNVEPFMTIKHDYPDKKVLLDVWKVYDWKGEPEGREDQEIIWTKLDSLESHKFPEANIVMLCAVCCISFYLLSILVRIQNHRGKPLTGKTGVEEKYLKYIFPLLGFGIGLAILFLN